MRKQMLLRPVCLHGGTWQLCADQPCTPCWCKQHRHACKLAKVECGLGCVSLWGVGGCRESMHVCVCGGGRGVHGAFMKGGTVSPGAVGTLRCMVVAWGGGAGDIKQPRMAMVVGCLNLLVVSGLLCRPGCATMLTEELSVRADASRTHPVCKFSHANSLPRWSDGWGMWCWQFGVAGVHLAGQHAVMVALPVSTGTCAAPQQAVVCNTSQQHETVQL